MLPSQEAIYRAMISIETTSSHEHLGEIPYRWVGYAQGPGDPRCRVALTRTIHPETTVDRDCDVGLRNNANASHEPRLISKEHCIGCANYSS